MLLAAGVLAATRILTCFVHMPNIWDANLGRKNSFSCILSFSELRLSCLQFLFK